MIHPSAIIDSSAVIHSTAIIGAYSVIGPNCYIGANTRIGNHCSLAGPPEHRDFWNKWSHSISIGDNCYISNGCTIDSGTFHNTMIGNNVTLLRQSHVGHDATIEDGCTLSCSVLIGGHTVVMTGANLGLNCTIHQNKIIPPYVMIGAQSFVAPSSQLEPFSVYVGVPIRFLKPNTVAIERAGLREEQIRELHDRYVKRISHL